VGVIHDLNLAASFGNQILLLSESRMLSFDTPQHVLTAQNIKDVYKLESTVLNNQGLHHIVFSGIDCAK
jgi:iron complex transport system ATP-binding protein